MDAVVQHQPVVHLRSTVCLLGRFPALAGIDLSVASGETVLVAGANGAGKTTLLRVLAGLLSVVEGDAFVLGCDLRANRRRLRPKVGLLGHGGALYDDLSVVDNLRFWARAARRPPASVDAAMVRLGLDRRLADVPAGRLSAGQRRRTSLAALVVRSPQLWLLDEPHAGLDAAGRDVLDDLVREAAASGSTVVLASHELDRARALADRCVVLAGGRISPDPATPIPPGPPLTASSPGSPVHVA